MDELKVTVCRVVVADASEAVGAKRNARVLANGSDRINYLRVACRTVGVGTLDEFKVGGSIVRIADAGEAVGAKHHTAILPDTVR